jgi:hypothetical protein
MNNTCQECKERMWPEDPSKPFYVGFNSKFRSISPLSGCIPPLCHGCSYYKEERIFNNTNTHMSLSSFPQDALIPLRAQVKYLENKLNEHIDKSKRKSKYI